MTEPTRPIRSQYEDFMRHVATHGVAPGDALQVRLTAADPGQRTITFERLP
jgi:hypothetical protein